MKNSSRALALAATLALTAAACGSDDPAADPAADAEQPADTGPTDTMGTDDMGTDDMDMDDMDTGEMNMGDPDATPADDVAGGALARGEYELMETRPQGYDDLAGTAVIARHPGGTTVTTEITGLLPNVEYISHLHAQACDDDNAGPHYQFEVGGATTPPNEIHLAFTSDNDGNGFMTAENDSIAGLEAVAFVVHPTEFIDNKIACVDFVEDEPGAAAAVIASGTDSGDDMEPMTTDMEPMSTDVATT
jgi:predicted small lipoprotein YifL